MSEKEQTHFGYETIDSEEKEGRVGAVFDSVAGKYDLMNDVMSAGIHRAWKNWYVWQTGVKPGEAVLDLAAGTGDITLRLAKRMRGKGAGADIEGRLVSSDINAAMLKIGEERLTNKGWLKNLEFVIANAEALPFADNSFDLITMAFGLRNVTHQDKALAEMARVLKPGGRVLVLEFSRPKNAVINRFYDWYSFTFLPKMGALIAKDADSYQYLAESIRMHPPQEELKAMFAAAGLADCEYQNLSNGIVAIHKGVKPHA
ncbi:MAG: bifunctional demethylmenaquinone methyltransferase/2-methoxy-6-polyprenyl-1,4-benzoquinol methylase UbiE [Cardiobacterium sp.]|jgi:ubiquinone/menaquinone biosynthesis methyltransferase ubiE|uniref:bifunctional demethylmenaquinone methyltransferase/2-methoxy-6-polyprenyl-1,4-benzoquinol methylase UbiE n=1 Tax=uncultured Cardiobacterium sp. TaxID=417619 RepID=UPI002611E9D9|nr:bifunctional demethylmenaquinone methyltransferase/2-methoxy-6-polyprenyl-1,4-benzoquinol methylase UbiE [uncultured Cardiobacterium sp.]